MCMPKFTLSRLLLPPTLRPLPELQSVLLNDAQHVLIGVPSVVRHQQVTPTRQQLDEGGAGT